MGLDFLDVCFRLERRFNVRLERADFEHLWNRKPFDLTAGELHEILCKQLHDAGRPVPISSWNAVRLELGDTLGMSPLQIRRETWMGHDLGMY